MLIFKKSNACLHRELQKIMRLGFVTKWNGFHPERSMVITTIDKVGKYLADESCTVPHFGCWIARRMKGVKMGHKPQTDYETYREIMTDLLKPISSDGLDDDTLKRLYESKIVYLENLRVKCFRDMNGAKETHFTKEDYKLILEALKQARDHLRGVVLGVINNRLKNIRSA